MSLNDINLNKKYNIKEDDRFINFLPNVFRCVITGSSGCGKTNLVLNILLKMIEVKKNLFFHFCTKTIDQELYKNFLKDVKGKCEYDINDEIKKFNESFYKDLDKSKKHIIIIDDMLGMMDHDDKKSLIHLFSASRPRKISIFFLTQRYTKIEISCRRNCNYLICFKPSYEEATTICNELIGGIITPYMLLQSFENSPYFCLFCDLEKQKILTIYEIFDLTDHQVYESLSSMINRVEILLGEIDAGNDSEKIENEIEKIIKKLINLQIVSY